MITNHPEIGGGVGNVEALKPWRDESPANPCKMPERLKQQREALRAAAMARNEAQRRWFDIPESVRVVLVGLCTNRDTMNAERLRWDQFTEAERLAIGVQARGFVRALSGVAGALR